MSYNRSYYILALLTLLLVSSGLTAQHRIIAGKVASSNGNAIVGVNVSVEGTVLGASTDVFGRFSLSAPLQGIVHFSHVGFADTSIHFSVETDSILLTLREHIEVLPVLDVLSEMKPEVVFGHEEMHVADLELLDDALLLLTYSRERMLKRHERCKDVIYRHPKLVLSDRGQNIHDIKYLNGEFVRLHKDHRQRLYVLGPEQVYLVKVHNKEMELHEVDMAQFQETIAPCVAQIENRTYFSNFDETYPSFSYFAFNEQDSTYNEICSIEDKPLMQLFRSQFKYMSGHDKVRAMDTELLTGIDAEVIAAYMTGFPDDQYFESLYAPMFVRQDQVLVFDHYEDLLCKYLPNGTKVQEVPLAYHKEKAGRHWKKLLLQDESSGAVFTVHQRNGRTTIRKIDLQTGSLGTPFTLFYRNVENLQVDNGEVYYIYRPFGSLQKKYLYKESIR